MIQLEFLCWPKQLKFVRCKVDCLLDEGGHGEKAGGGGGGIGGK